MKNKIHFFNSIAAEPKKRTTFLLVTTVLLGIHSVACKKRTFTCAIGNCIFKQKICGLRSCA